MLLHPTVPITQTTSSGLNVLNPNADVFRRGVTTPVLSPSDGDSGVDVSSSSTAATHWPDTPLSDLSVTNITTGSVAVNGGGVVQMAVVYPSSTPVVGVSPVSSEYGSLNNSQADLQLPPSSTVLFTAGVDGQASNDESTVLEDFIPADQLRAMLTTQLEYYFSRENLANDTYLVSQMDADQFVPITTVAAFNQIKRLTRNVQLIVDILRDSPNVQVDETGEKVRPLHKRCIVILREIPESTPVQEVENLFSGPSCPKFISCQFAHNDSWYVTFDSEEHAQKAYRYLREEVQTFHGIPIMARIKAKPLLRSGGSFIAKEAAKSRYDSTVYAPTKYTYTSPVPSIQYITPQALPFFSPQTTMSPLWSASIAYFDPGMVLAANGYIPTAAFLPQSPFLVPGSVSSARVRTPNSRRQDHGDAGEGGGSRRAVGSGTGVSGWNSASTGSGGRNADDEMPSSSTTAYGRQKRGGGPPMHTTAMTTTTSRSSPLAHGACCEHSYHRANNEGSYCCAGSASVQRTGTAALSPSVRNSAGLPRCSCSSDTANASTNVGPSPDHVSSSSSASTARERSGLFSNRSAGGIKPGRRKNRNSIGDGPKQSLKSGTTQVEFELEDKYFPPLPTVGAQDRSQLPNGSADPPASSNVEKRSTTECSSSGGSSKESQQANGSSSSSTPDVGDMQSSSSRRQSIPPRASTVSIKTKSKKCVPERSNPACGSNSTALHGPVTTGDSQSAGRPSYAQMAQRGKEKQNAESAEVPRTACGEKQVPSTLREQQLLAGTTRPPTMIRNSLKKQSGGTAADTSVGVRMMSATAAVAKENRVCSEGSDVDVRTRQLRHAAASEAKK